MYRRKQLSQAEIIKIRAGYGLPARKDATGKSCKRIDLAAFPDGFVVRRESAIGKAESDAAALETAWGEFLESHYDPDTTRGHRIT